MRVKIGVEFDVEPVDLEDGDEMEEHHAKGAASAAAWNHLDLVQIQDGQSHGERGVEVHVDGFGLCLVKLGEEHD